MSISVGASRTRLKVVPLHHQSVPALRPLSFTAIPPQPYSARFSPADSGDAADPNPTQRHIQILQGMIHEYELEIQILKDKIQTSPQSGAVSLLGPTDKETPIDVTVRDLRLLCLKIEQDMKDEQAVSSFLRFVSTDGCFSLSETER
jgi:hypothetical protein